MYCSICGKEANNVIYSDECLRIDCGEAVCLECCNDCPFEGICEWSISQSGAVTVEHVLLLIGISCAIVLFISLFGDSVRSLFNSATDIVRVP